MQKEKIWSKFFIVMCLIGLMGTSVNFMLDNTLTIYAAYAWPANSSSIAGYLTTTFTAGSITAALFAGTITDKVGRQKVLIIGILCFLLGIAAMMITKNVAFNMCCRVLQGIGKGIFGVSGMAVAADVLPRARMGEGMALFGLGSSLATAFGPMLGLAIIANGNYTLMFVVDVLLFVVALALAFFLNYEKKEPYQSRIAEERAEAERIAATVAPQKGLWKFFEKGAVPSSVTCFFYGAGCTCILIYLTIFATTVLNIPNAQAGGFFTAAAIAMFITQLTVGKIIDRYGVTAVVTCGFSALILCIVLLITVGSSYVMYILCGVLYGLSMELIYPALSAASIQDSPKNRRGAASSTYAFMMDFGILIASALMGVIAQNFGYYTMFLSGVVFNVIGIVLTVALMRNAARAKRRKRLGVED